MEKLLDEVISIAQKAGSKIMEIYGSRDFEIETKSDESPLTNADRAANELIVNELQKISKLDIVSEEGNHETSSDEFWLVDPLDGTKEFIKRNGEFTVNIALVNRGVPVLGVVYAPDKDVLYAGLKEGDAFKLTAGKRTPIKSFYSGKVPTVVASRSHRDERISKLLEAIGEHKEISMGSSLKLCLVAEGEAQIYPRLAPTCLWDTAAADAVLRAAGGRTENLNGDLLTYIPKENIKNPFFIASTNNSPDYTGLFDEAE